LHVLIWMTYWRLQRAGLRLHVLLWLGQHSLGGFG